MQAVIAKCLEELVQEKFGKEHWSRVLAMSGLGPETIFADNAEITDETIMTVMRNTCDVLEITPLEIAEAFKDYWAQVFAPKLYQTCYTSAKEMFLKNEAPPERPKAKLVLMH